MRPDGDGVVTTPFRLLISAVGSGSGHSYLSHHKLSAACCPDELFVVHFTSLLFFSYSHFFSSGTGKWLPLNFLRSILFTGSVPLLISIRLGPPVGVDFD